jgi:hypothetical protein
LVLERYADHGRAAAGNPSPGYCHEIGPAVYISSHQEAGHGVDQGSRAERYFLRHQTTSYLFIILPHYLSPPVFSETLARGRAPFYAGRCLFAVDVLSALLAAEAGFIREYFNKVAAGRAFVYCRAQIFTILTGAFPCHFDTS